MSNEVKAGFGGYLRSWFDSLVPTTRAMQEYVGRDYPKAVFWGPGYQVDSIEDLLATYRANDNSGAPGTSANLPVTIATMSRDYLPAVEWQGRTAGEDQWVIIPDDPKERIFKMREAQVECRTQLVFISADEVTARSLAVQFHAFASKLQNRRFPWKLPFAGVTSYFHATIETPDLFINGVPLEQKNLTAMTMDLNLRLVLPFIFGPKGSEANDGKGTDGDLADPHGFPYVKEITVRELPSKTLDTIAVDESQPGEPVFTHTRSELP